MLRTNPLQPPRPFFPVHSSTDRPPLRTAGRVADSFVSAEDFDRTGILTGMDPCESRYWWIPELYAAEPPTEPTRA